MMAQAKRRKASWMSSRISHRMRSRRNQLQQGETLLNDPAVHAQPGIMLLAAHRPGHAADADPRGGQDRSLSPSPHGRTLMIVFPLRRSVGLRAATASSRVATLPMFVRSRPSRTRCTTSPSWARSDSITKSTARPSAGRASVGPTTEACPAFASVVSVARRASIKYCWPDQALAGAGSWLTPVVGGYVLTAENLITGSLAVDDVAMGGYHIGIHRPSRSGWRWDRGRPATEGGLQGGDHARFRRPQT